MFAKTLENNKILVIAPPPVITNWQGAFKDFNIKLPDLDKIEKFEKIVEINYKKISSNLEENNTLTQLRDTLLPKLMNGEIDLDKIEI